MKSLLFLILLTNPVLAEDCYIVSDGSLFTFIHEKGHCNGWRHPPFTNSGLPPLEFIHDYDGTMHVYITNGDDASTIKAHAQKGTIIVQMPDDAATLCTGLWRKYHVPMPDSTNGMSSLLGCAVALNDQGSAK